MSTLDINAIREYLLQVGCKIEYPILVNAFKSFLYNPDPNVQGRIRTQFKDYVNRLATVSLENNMKFIILRPEFRPSEPQPKLAPETNPSGMGQTADNRQQFNNQQNHAKQMPPIPSRTTVPPSIQHKMPPPPPTAAQSRPPLVPQHQKRIDSQVFTQQPQMVAIPPVHSQSLSFPSSLDQQHRQQQQQQQCQQQQQQSRDLMASRINAPNLHSPQTSESMNDENSLVTDVHDGKAREMLAAPFIRRSQMLQRPESFNMSSSGSAQMPPPRPPPRRRTSTASLFKPGPRLEEEKSKEIDDLAKRSPGRVKEHALKLNSSASSTDLNALMPLRAMKENRLSRDSTTGSLASSALQRTGSHMTTRSRSSHREDESDSSSLQPIDPLRRKWAIEACNCNYNGLLQLLREDTKLASYRDIVNGYTALHWAAKFGNLDVIKLIAGTHGVSANIKSSAGYTPLHVACMFNRKEVADLLLKSYKANPNLRDHSGKRALQYQN